MPENSEIGPVKWDELNIYSSTFQDKAQNLQILFLIFEI